MKVKFTIFSIAAIAILSTNYFVNAEEGGYQPCKKKKETSNPCSDETANPNAGPTCNDASNLKTPSPLTQCPEGFSTTSGGGRTSTPSGQKQCVSTSPPMTQTAPVNDERCQPGDSTKSCMEKKNPKCFVKTVRTCQDKFLEATCHKNGFPDSNRSCRAGCETAGSGTDKIDVAGGTRALEDGN